MPLPFPAFEFVGDAVGGDVGGTGAGVGFEVGAFVGDVVGGDVVVPSEMEMIAVPGVVEISIESTVIVTVFPVPPKFEMACDCP